jgi:hypothetical protein
MERNLVANARRVTGPSNLYLVESVVILRVARAHGFDRGGLAGVEWPTVTELGLRSTRSRIHGVAAALRDRGDCRKVPRGLRHPGESGVSYAA